MKVFAKRLERMISLNRLEQAIDTFLDTLSEFEPIDSDGKEESRLLRNQIITLSQRLHQASDNLKGGRATEADVNRERRNVSTTMLEIMGDMDRYPAFLEHIREMEDEEAWQAASKSNTIAAYQEYFDNFPNGKYTSQTKEIIQDLQEVERRRANEMKQIAEEEKKRRTEAFNRERQEENRQRQTRKEQTQNQRPSFSSNTNKDTKPTYQRRARPVYGSQESSTPSGNNEKENWSNTFIGLSYAASVLLSLVGIGIGAYLRLAKKNGAHRYDEATRNHGLFILIVGIVFWFISFSLYTNGY
ncbi:MAG: hypothetical protein GYB31_15435 [Bacteroidetes bacterium]|nr:hypothetical protein [Bacteroidota bacterium]